jgi:hypothetical protein
LARALLWAPCHSAGSDRLAGPEDLDAAEKAGQPAFLNSSGGVLQERERPLSFYYHELVSAGRVARVEADPKVFQGLVPLARCMVDLGQVEMYARLLQPCTRAFKQCECPLQVVKRLGGLAYLVGEHAQ